METSKSYENYPEGIVLTSNTVSLLIYSLGFLIIFGLGLVFSLFYLLYILILEFRLLRYHCTNCYYFGRTCGFGKGRISSWLFQKGDVAKFCSNDFTWKDMIPDLLVSLIPFITGIVLLILNFNLLLLAALLLLSILTTSGNGFVRGKLTCKNCKQREMGCPAYELFNKG